MFFDSHTHLNSEKPQFREELFRKIEESDVDFVIDVGYDLASSKLAYDHSQILSWCYCAVGCHPHDTKFMDDTELFFIEDLAKKDKVQAIGEIGLDFHYNHSDPETQRYWFRRQIQLALKLKKPIIIHSREADQEVMDILIQEGAFSEERKQNFPKRKDGSGDARVLLHCYSGSAELAKQYVRLGATISIAGPVTYKNNKKTVNVVETISLDYLLIETDAPYLAPEPKRGKKNMSPYIEHTARRIALIKNISLEEVASRTKENAMVFFNISREV